MSTHSFRNAVTAANKQFVDLFEQALATNPEIKRTEEALFKLSPDRRAQARHCRARSLISYFAILTPNNTETLCIRYIQMTSFWPTEAGSSSHLWAAEMLTNRNGRL